jgi:hypothetical protein
MYDIINNGGHGNDNVIGTTEGTQAEAYDIDGIPFFDTPSVDCTTFYADGQGEDESEDGEDDGTDPDGDVPEDATCTTAAKKKKVSKRTAGYTPKEDVCLCRSWLAISQDAISGAEQKGKAYWKRMTEDEQELSLGMFIRCKCIYNF